MGLRNTLLMRKQAYQQILSVLPPDMPFRVRLVLRLLAVVAPAGTDYNVVFRGVFANRVLADLRRFCKATSPSFVQGDPHATSLNEGRREVWNRILAHLHLTEAQVYNIVEDYGDE